MRYGGNAKFVSIGGSNTCKEKEGENVALSGFCIRVHCAPGRVPKQWQRKTSLYNHPANSALYPESCGEPP